ncbi:50S ribosomal protein L13 [Patescibacteria group bacterium]|nr:MAG: 50S ribosomal protein L13 [Patescibacteria group bacterium]
MKQIERKWHLVDAQGKVLGRLATSVAWTLGGKAKTDYVAHIDGGDAVVVINADGVRVTGNKAKQKMYHRFSGYPGGITSVAFEDRMKNGDSCKVIYDAVYGMLPKNKLRKTMLKRLFIYRDDKHAHKIDVTK